jgi:TonB family protein
MNIRLISACSLAAALSVSVLNPLSAAGQNATPLLKVAPVYSPELRASDVEGEVVVSFTISPRGDVLNPTVVSSTAQLLDKPTLVAVSKWKFSPAMKDGVAVSQKAVLPVSFSMESLQAATTTRLVTSAPKPVSKTSPTSAD